MSSAICEQDREVAAWYANDLRKGEANIEALIRFLEAIADAR